MKTSTWLLIASILLIGLISCDKEDCDCRSDAPVLFQYEFVNHAWGYRHQGFLIDPDGKVLGFKNPKDWRFPDSLGFLSEEDLALNREYCDTLCGTVDEDSLWEFYEDLEKISNKTIKDHGMMMADAGTGVLSGWVWNEEKEAYENIFLRSNGDLFKENTDPKAEAIVNWLKRTGEKSNLFWWFD